MRAPNWTKDELILALDLYFRQPDAIGNAKHEKVIELSELLNSLPIHNGGVKQQKFRNPNGIGMKLANFLRYDPSYKGAGLKQGSALEEVVWNEFSSDKSNLSFVAEAIKENTVHFKAELPQVESDEEDEASEGQVLTKVHKFRERNAALVKKKKKQVLEKTGKLACEACDFDFVQKYGSLGFGFAECHHDKPVSTLKPNEKTKISDLRILCANCHRMLHRANPWINVADLKDLMPK
ncbi:TPA: HNH endonuclease [Vibrio parahaemolyticus]|uniref:HNH endonuclease n=1 Tax=Vibrio parahaemolyticus TaxID=670 RepID=UPI000413821A|nr:HNH endonuclease [Vibrio parahaemolyticus]HCG8133058.1 HNH endonuclease [Vibrio parahaemolyticus]